MPRARRTNRQLQRNAAAAGTSQSPQFRKFQARRDSLICLGLILLIALAYWPVARNEFVSFDDDGYVVENEYVNQGLSAEGVKWAFTSMTREANWHPLTW